MYSTDCGGCIFAQYTDQNITGCLHNRQDKYGYTTVFNDDFSGTRRIVLDHICTAKRTKKWLSEYPTRPELAVRQELYPKVQLIVIIESLTDEWLDFFKSNNFDKYSAVDVLVFSGKDIFNKLGYLVNKDKFFLHTCFITDPSVSFEKELQRQINYIVRDDCKFYLTIDYPEYNGIAAWADRLDYYLNDLLKPVFLVYDDIVDVEVSFQDCMLVYTPLHITLGGFGSQNIIDKIFIHCTNHDQLAGVHSYENFWTESVDGLPTTDNTDGALT